MVPSEARARVDVDRAFGVVPSGVTDVPVIGPKAQLAAIRPRVVPGRPGSRAARGTQAPH